MHLNDNDYDDKFEEEQRDISTYHQDLKRSQITVLSDRLW